MLIQCLIRKALVARTPEEEVRQRLLLYLIQQKGYPEGLIAVEKNLATLPHLEGQSDLPDRRADIVVFSKNFSSLIPFPLFLIECKAGPFREEIFRQIIGYNQFVKARWIAIANRKSIHSAYLVSSQGWVFERGIPDYEKALALEKNNG